MKNFNPYYFYSFCGIFFTAITQIYVQLILSVKNVEFLFIGLYLLMLALFILGVLRSLKALYITLFKREKADLKINLSDRGIMKNGVFK